MDAKTNFPKKKKIKWKYIDEEEERAEEEIVENERSVCELKQQQQIANIITC
jgi:hypothetical protein